MVDLNTDAEGLPTSSLPRDANLSSEPPHDVPNAPSLMNSNEAQAIADIADTRGKQLCFVCGCGCELSRVLQIDCGEHWLCLDCVGDVFEMATMNESCYPPRCCDLLDRLYIEDFEHVIQDATLVDRYKQKVQEYRTSVMFRRYCGNSDCGKFLPIRTYIHSEDRSMTTARCRTCGETTCISCTEILLSREVSHSCTPKMQAAKTGYDWYNARMKPCPYCREGVEIIDGCNHISCRCNNEWCFDCLLPWNDGDEHIDCQEHNDPDYDEDGYNARGLHRDTGLDREGFNANGVNIRGLNRRGEAVPSFTISSEHRFLSRTANRPLGLLGLQDDDFEEAGLAQLLHEVANGTTYDTDDADALIEENWGLIHQADFNTNDAHHNQEEWADDEEHWGGDGFDEGDELESDFEARHSEGNNQDDESEEGRADEDESDLQADD